MIRVTSAPVPPRFESEVRQPGLRAIAERVGKAPASPRRAGKRFKVSATREEDIHPDDLPSYWTKALDDLMTAYGRICAYSCFRIHPVTGARSVDHMAAKSRAWDKVYEWSNYRLASTRLNARKREFGDVLDPVEVQDGWFELELAGFLVKPAQGLDATTGDLVQATINRLGLNDFRQDRARDAEYYWSGDVSLRVLMEESPFVAKELRRQGKLRPGDV